jgi:hypothetical protein
MAPAPASAAAMPAAAAVLDAPAALQPRRAPESFSPPLEGQPAQASRSSAESQPAISIESSDTAGQLTTGAGQLLSRSTVSLQTVGSEPAMDAKEPPRKAGFAEERRADGARLEAAESETAAGDLPRSAALESNHPVDRQDENSSAAQSGLVTDGSLPIEAGSQSAARSALHASFPAAASGASEPARSGQGAESVPSTTAGLAIETKAGAGAPGSEKRVAFQSAQNQAIRTDATLAGSHVGAISSAEGVPQIPAPVHGAAAIGNPAQLSGESGAAIQTSAREAFAALDAAPGGVSWVHAGAQRAEAGFEDPALGWVGVRADLSAGGIHAAVLPSSVEAARTLGAHLEGLNSYLSAQQIPVATLTMTTAQGGPGGEAGAMQQGSGQHPGPGGEAGSGAEPPANLLSGAPASVPTADSGSLSDAVALPAMASGTHISVIA